MRAPGPVALRDWLPVLAVAGAAFAGGVGLRALNRAQAVAAAAGVPVAVETADGEPEAAVAPRPRLVEVLAAPESSRLAVAARYLEGAALPDIVALAEAWEFDADRAPEAAWALLLACWAEKDGPGALAAARRVDGEASSRHAFLVLRVWTETDPAAALAEAEAEPALLLPAIIATLARTSLDLALGVLGRHPGREDLVVPVLGILAETDPADAMARARALPGAEFRKRAMAEVARVWAKTDPEAALAWLADDGGGDGEARALRNSMLRGLIETDPALADQRLRAMEAGQDRYGQTLALARRKAGEDAGAALAWAKSLPEGPERHAALARSVTALAGGDPAKLLALLDEVGWDIVAPNPADSRWTLLMNGSSSGSSSDGSAFPALRDALAKLALEDPEQALGHAARLPGPTSDNSGSERLEAVDGILASWFSTRPEEALAWLGEWPDQASAAQARARLPGGQP